MSSTLQRVEDEPAPSPVPGGGPLPSLSSAVLDPLVTGVVRPMQVGVRALERRLGRIPAARIWTTLPKTTGFALRAVQRRPRHRPPGLPATRVTPSLLGWVAMDEAIMTLTVGPERFPHREDYARVSAEVAAAYELFDGHGITTHPRRYHAKPPPLTDDQLTVTRGRVHGLNYEQLEFPSGWSPLPGEPGAERWASYEPNHTAGAWVLRHDDPRPRPWLVCVHGYTMGRPLFDFPAFRAAHLFHDLGMNVVGPTLPLHGARKVGPVSGDQFIGFDVMNTIHAVAQATWDVRRVLDWVRRQQPGPAGIGLFGISLGSYVTAMVSAFEPDLRAAIAGVPVVDFAGLLPVLCPPAILERAHEHRITGGDADLVQRACLPLALPVAVPAENRFIFAGLADRVSRPKQAHLLWQHWQEPRIRWYPGNHFGYLWSTKVQAFLDEILVAQGLTRPPG